MHARLPDIPATSFDRPISLPLSAPLGARLDAALIALPVVIGVGADPGVEALVRPLGLAEAGLVIRRVRILDGRSVTVTAVPAITWVRPDGRDRVLALKRAARTAGRRVVLVPEGTLDRDPRMADALLIAGCAGARVAPGDRLALTIALMQAGGSMPLADAAELMVRSHDPVAAVLALVAGRVVGLDLRGPVGPDSQVLSLAGRVRTTGGRR